VDQQIGFTDFLERRLKRLDQHVRQIAQETDGVREQHPLFVRQGEAAGSRIECGEQPIYRENIRAGEQIEQRGLAGVRVADHRRDWPLMTAPTFALHAADLADAFELAFQLCDSLLHASAVHFELRLARSPGADAARLPREVRPHTREPRQQILQLRELDLQPPFPAPRPLREDVENQLRAIEHLALEELLEVPALRG
jgi:hypothetical protein